MFLGDLDPEAVGASLEFATHYEATPVSECGRLLDAIPPDLTDATFIDVGSGMGRVVLLASQRPFARIVGIEISPALHEIARDNLRTAHGFEQRCRDIRLVRCDAAEFAYPRGKVVLYLYNPFRAPVLEAVLERASAAAEELVVIYHTQVERETLEASDFTTVEDLKFGVVYRRVTPAT